MANSAVDSPSKAADGDKFDRVGYLTEDQFWEPIRGAYAQSLEVLTPEDVYPSPTPGPSNPDGSVNFECPCVGHLVASPCGWEFREAITCQKANPTDDKGKCAEALMGFMKCVMETDCFKKNPDNKSDDEKAE